MSTSDSDCSIDWLASDEDDNDSPGGLSPERAEEPLVSPSSSSDSSSTTSCSHCGAAQRWRRRRKRRRSDCCECKDGGGCGVNTESPAAPQTAAVSPIQGFTSVYTQQTLPVESMHHAARTRRAHGAETPQTDTDNELFSQKCSELQCYIQPLSSILQGLRSGRYSERLSSFQESVAMDRLQRIMGALQNPNMGGRFLSIILKIEEMLLSWFPHVKPTRTRADGDAPAKRQKQHHSSASTPPPLCPSDVAADPAAWSSSTHLHTMPIYSLKTPELMLGQRATAVVTTTASPLPTHDSQKVMQDNAVSSSTDLHAGHLCRSLAANPRLIRGALPFKMSSPCLEQLLQAKDSIIIPRTDAGWAS